MELGKWLELINLKVQFKEVKDSLSVEFNGEFTILSLDSLKGLIIGVLDKYKKIRLNCNHISKIDTAGIQFLISMKKEFEKSLVEFTFEKKSDEFIEMEKFYQLEI